MRSSGVKWEAAQRHGQINKRGQQGSRTEARRTQGCEERGEKGKQGWHDYTETTVKQRNVALGLESCTRGPTQGGGTLCTRSSWTRCRACSTNGLGDRDGR